MTPTNRPTIQEATRTFLEIFSNSRIADSIDTALSCIEVDALTALLRAAGASHAADKWLADHAHGDDEGDLHYEEGGGGMSAFLVDAEHIHVMIHAALTYGGGANGNLSVVTDDEPTPYNGVQIGWGCNMRVLRRGTESAFGQMLLDANAASVNARYNEDEAYVYTYQRPEHFDWEPVEILGAINGYEYQACEAPGWITSEARAFCDRLRRLAESRLPNASDAPWTISPGDMPLHKRLAAEKRAHRA